MIGFTVFLLVFIMLAYHRASLLIWTGCLAALLVLVTKLNGLSIGATIGWVLLLGIFIPLNITNWRRRLISSPLLRFYRNVMPTMSRTEREAISAGTVTWEG